MQFTQVNQNVGDVVSTLAMPRCATCKWWDLSSKDTETDMRTEDYDEVPILHMKCRCPGIVDVSDHMRFYSVPLTGAGYHDVESYRATFRTGPEFGCTLHQPKSEAHGKD